MPSCAMCGLRDPEQHTDYEPDVPLAKLPAWAELNAHECALRVALDDVERHVCRGVCALGCRSWGAAGLVAATTAVAEDE